MKIAIKTATMPMDYDYMRETPDIVLDLLAAQMWMLGVNFIGNGRETWAVLIKERGCPCGRICIQWTIVHNVTEEECLARSQHICACEGRNYMWSEYLHFMREAGRERLNQFVHLTDVGIEFGQSGLIPVRDVGQIFRKIPK